MRIGIHTGASHLTEEGYVGADVHRAARIAAAGHGGQVLVSAAAASFLDPDGLRELGEHRLKDFDDPVPLYQLGAEDFPPLKTISNTNLPRPASSFVGRGRELEEVTSLLRDEARLLTLTGPGGAGKTRLAVEAAAELVPDFKAGVFWIELAALRDPALVTAAIAQTLGAKNGLAEHIAERELLLLLDNLEQVLAAAPELASLVESCPNLRLLATSRELLRVRGEREYPVPALVEEEAVTLFCARARIEPDESVRELCRALDNLPLALELAAARANVLSPQETLARLSQRLDLLKGGRDADPRQQTLRATIEWSHELLGAEERRLFARLAVCAGGCTLEVAEAVAGADLETLGSLVDKSLVRRRGERFTMLETIREYAAEQLEASGKADEIRRRHAGWCLALGEEARAALMAGQEQEAWVARLEAEHDNMRAALGSLASEPEGQLELAAALGSFWDLHGHLSEGRRWLEEALARSSPEPRLVRGRAFTQLGAMASVQGDHARARECHEESLAIARHLGQPFPIAVSLNNLGLEEMSLGDLERSEALLEEALSLHRELGNDQRVAETMVNLGYGALLGGRYDRAAEQIAASVELIREGEDKADLASALHALTVTEHHRGEPDRARELAGEALELAVALGYTEQIWSSLEALAAVSADERSARLLGGAEALREAAAGRLDQAEQALHERTVAATRARLGEEAFAAAWAAGAEMSVDELVALAGVTRP